jgi:hypothetical protein
MSLARDLDDEGRYSSLSRCLVEWYDYFLYGLAASVVFTQLFFPLENRLFVILAPFIATALLAWRAATGQSLSM